MEEQDNVWTIDRILLAIALFGGATGTSLGMFGTDDRFYGEEGRELRVRIEYLEKATDRQDEDIRRLDDNHPPAELLAEIGELRQRVRQLEAKKNEH